MTDTVSRFDGLASDYARYRPTYPHEALDDVLYGLGPPETLRVADVGAGTGISTALLRGRGIRNVVGIEPNAGMRAIAISEGLDVRDAVADRLPFDDASIDAITAFQAFHWFAHAAAAAEFARVLTPAGRIGIVWNERDDDDAFTRAYGEAVDAYAKRLAPNAFATVSPTASELLAGLFPSPRWYLRASVVPHVQRFDRAGVHGRARSTSYAPRHGDARATMSRELDRLFDDHRDASGTVAMRMLAQVYVLDRNP